MLLRRDTHVQLVYKHDISTIMPGGPLSLYDEEEEVVPETSDVEADDEAGEEE